MHTPEFSQIPLGTPIPGDTPHAVSFSLPTMANVEDFRYGDPETHSALRTTYPRFGIHPLTRQALAGISVELPAERHSMAVNSPRYAESVIEKCALSDTVITEHGPLTVITYPHSDLKVTEVARYLRATGGVASSRRAERYLVEVGELSAAHPEPTVAEDTTGHIVRRLQSFYPDCQFDVRLANSGMSSIYALAHGTLVADPQKTDWLVFGETYSDTVACIKAAGSKAECFEDMQDYDRLVAYLQASPERAAAIFTEAPNNPLLQTADLDRLAGLARQYDIPLVVDISVAGSATIDVSPYADIIVESLTKFASGHGDMMMGAVLFNKHSPYYESLIASSAPFIDAPFSGDLARMAYEIDGYQTHDMRRIGEHTLQLIEFLERQPEIGAIHWSGSAANRANFATIVRDADQPANVFTFVPNGGLTPLYDQLPVAKGASFGIRDIAIHTPYVHLAHPENIDFPEGQAALERMGLDPDMLRVSVSAQPIEEQVAAYDFAFRQLRR